MYYVRLLRFLVAFKEVPTAAYRHISHELAKFHSNQQHLPHREGDHKPVHLHYEISGKFDHIDLN